MEHLPFQASPYWVEHLMEFYKENLGQVDVVFLGDSNTQLFPIHEYFKDFTCANRGIQGDLSVGINITMEERVCKLQPKVLYLMIGGNDIAYWGYNDDITIQNIHDGLNYVRQLNKGCKIILCSVAPCCYYQAKHIVNDQNIYRPKHRILELNQKIKQYAEAHDDITFFDLHALVCDENNSLPLDYTIDGLHLSKKAYDIIAAALHPIILSLLKENKS